MVFQNVFKRIPFGNSNMALTLPFLRGVLVIFYEEGFPFLFPCVTRLQGKPMQVMEAEWV